jgi:hypothetical protein
VPNWPQRGAQIASRIDGEPSRSLFDEQLSPRSANGMSTGDEWCVAQQDFHAGAVALEGLRAELSQNDNWQ